MNTPFIPDNQIKENDEIDVLELFKSALATWRSWIIALTIVSLCFGAIKALQVIIFNDEISYSKPIRLTFPNAHNLTFPSGAKFAYSDIVSPAVVKIAYDRNNIAEAGISVAELQAALTATPHSPQYPLILKRYGMLMSDKKLSADQIGNLQKQMEKDVEQAVAGEALITLRLKKKQLPEEIVNRILSDIPAIWADAAIKQKGVLNINVQLASANSINRDLILNEDPLVAADIISEKLQILRLNISKLSEYEGAQSISDPQTGMKILDLTYAVDDMSNYLLGSLVAPIRELGLTNATQKTIFYYQDRIKKLTLQLDALNKKALSVKTVYDSYNQTLNSNNVASSGNTTTISEINLDLVDKLVSLSGDSDRQKYRQSLHSEWLKLEGQAADLELAIQDAQQILLAVKKSIGIQHTDEYKTYLEATQKQVPVLLDKLIDFYRISGRLYSQLSIESVGVKDQLYIPITDSVILNRVLIDIKSTVLVWIALMFLTTVLVVPAMMIRNAIKGRK
ncbi:MAG TPA: hypothetical protein VL995_08745 [Cellvibrio sp.]|nr:hypothetical protein [Cellvibrio sp.]